MGAGGGCLRQVLSTQPQQPFQHFPLVLTAEEQEIAGRTLFRTGDFIIIAETEPRKAADHRSSNLNRVIELARCQDEQNNDATLWHTLALWSVKQNALYLDLAPGGAGRGGAAIRK